MRFQGEELATRSYTPEDFKRWHPNIGVQFGGSQTGLAAQRPSE
jgi:hypothetical protein